MQPVCHEEPVSRAQPRGARCPEAGFGNASNTTSPRMPAGKCGHQRQGERLRRAVEQPGAPCSRCWTATGSSWQPLSSVPRASDTKYTLQEREPLGSCAVGWGVLGRTCVGAKPGACFSSSVLESKAALQRDLGKLETWFGGNLGWHAEMPGKGAGEGAGAVWLSGQH